MSSELSPELKEISELRVAPHEWPAALVRTDGPQIVVGGPGTGKTEFLVRRVVHLVEVAGVDPERVQLLSFSRRAVSDLDRRLHAALSRPARPVPTATFHSLAARLVEAHADETRWGTTPQLLTGPEQTALVAELLRREDPKDWATAFRSLLTTATFAAEVTDAALRSAELMLESSDISRMAQSRQDWRGLAGFLDRYRDELIRRNRIDYAQLLFEATTLLERGIPELDRFEYVVVDEYQDTSLAQARLLRAMTAASHNLVTAADPYQSIYSFRGARVANVAAFGDEMPHDNGPPPVRIVLTTSFRTPQAILAAAERITSGSLPGAAGPVEPAMGDGAVTVHVFDQQTAEAEWIAGEIERTHLVDGIAHGDMAVFVRSSRRFVAELSRALERRRIAHDVPTDRLAENPTVRYILDVVTAATASGLERDRAIRSLLVGPAIGLTLGEARALERAMRSDGRGWSDALRDIGRAGVDELAELVDDAGWATETPAELALWRLWLVTERLSDIALAPGRRDERTAWASLQQVIGRWNERNPEGTLSDYQRLLAAAEFEARPLLSYEPADADQLTVTTMHQAKGLEFEVVFIADAVDGVLPDLRVRDSLLGVRHMLPDVPTDPAGYRLFRLAEERRLAYTAMTRARSRVVWTATATGVELGQGAPSRFLPLVAGVATMAEAASPVSTERPPVTPAEAEAAIRRRLGDPELPAEHRLAALDVLSRGPAWRMRSLDGFTGVRTRGPDTGLVPRDAPLSATQADGYNRCPRRYVMERRLGIGQGETNHLVFGRLIHSVIEAASREAMANGEAHPSRELVLEQLAIQFDAAGFGGPPYDAAWLRRAIVTLEAYLDKRPEAGKMAAVEHEFELAMPDRTWRGLIDAVIDRGDGRTHIVDYKTGSSVATKAEAAESIQLGLYLLAAAHDPQLSGIGSPAAAEYWYLYDAVSRQGLTTRSFDPANTATIAIRLEEIAAGIAADDWRPEPGEHCVRCPVRRSCPAMPEGAEGFVA